MFEAKFKLRQHTPMIHFLHDQPGATLRGTELKPKLDKFIAKKTNTPFSKDWIARTDTNGHIALDYKVSIIPAPDLRFEPIEIPYINHKGKQASISFPGFFANLGGRSNDDVKKFSIANEDFEIVFFSYHEDLIEQIKTLFPEFLAFEEFGTRQSKGFGSFYLSEIEQNPLDQFFEYSFNVNTNDIVLPRYIRLHERQQEYKNTLPEYTRFFKLFFILNTFYSTLRSGINHSGVYFKSLMFMYSKQQKPPIIWDKKLIRKKFQLYHPKYKEIQQQRTDPEGTFLYPVFNEDGHKKRLMRDMLGLSSEQSWLSYSDTITKSHDEIARFKSPIHFKIINKGKENFQIYLHTSKIPVEMYEKHITINSKNYRPSKNEADFTLQTPSSTEFNLDDYLDFCFKRLFQSDFDFENHFEIDPAKEDEARKAIVDPLIKIYNQLRNQE
jgi:hypothetical protein